MDGLLEENERERERERRCWWEDLAVKIREVREKGCNGEILRKNERERERRAFFTAKAQVVAQVCSLPVQSFVRSFIAASVGENKTVQSIGVPFLGHITTYRPRCCRLNSNGEQQTCFEKDFLTGTGIDKSVWRSNISRSRRQIRLKSWRPEIANFQNETSGLKKLAHPHDLLRFGKTFFHNFFSQHFVGSYFVEIIF